MNSSAFDRSAGRHAAGRGFSIVELLVVVSIIAILISLLLPALKNAMAVSKNIGCLSNLRELGFGDQMYCNTYMGNEFTAWQVQNMPGGGQQASAWTNPLNPYVTTGGIGAVTNNADSGVTVYTCPAAYNPHLPIGNAGNQFLLTYGVNCSVHTWGWPAATTTPLHNRMEIHRPQEIINFVDAAQSSGAWTCAGWIDGSDNWYNNPAQASQPLPIIGNADVAGGLYGIRYRHGNQNSTCVEYLDGHAASSAMGTLLYRNMSTAY